MKKITDCFQLLLHLLYAITISRFLISLLTIILTFFFCVYTVLLYYFLFSNHEHTLSAIYYSIFALYSFL